MSPIVPLLLLSVIVLVSCGVTTTSTMPPQKQPARVSSKIASVKEVIYTPANWPAALPASIFRPSGIKDAPAVLLIHGGGWNGGDKRSQMDGLAKKLARRGYLVVSPTYRTTPQWQHPAPVEDVAQCLRWMRKNATSLNLDPSRISAFGYSAGAHLATMVGFQDDTTWPALRGIVAGGTPANLSLFDSGKLVRLYLGGTREEKPARYREASPVNHVTRDSPPVFIYHGKMDRLVPINQAEALRTSLAAKNVGYEYHVLQGRAHITTFLFSGGTVTKAIDFLDRLNR